MAQVAPARPGQAAGPPGPEALLQALRSVHEAGTGTPSQAPANSLMPRTTQQVWAIGPSLGPSHPGPIGRHCKAGSEPGHDAGLAGGPGVHGLPRRGGWPGMVPQSHTAHGPEPLLASSKGVHLHLHVPHCPNWAAWWERGGLPDTGGLPTDVQATAVFPGESSWPAPLLARPRMWRKESCPLPISSLRP